MQQSNNDDGDIDRVFHLASGTTKCHQIEGEMCRLNEELKVAARERTAELKKTNDELEQFNDIFVGRELRMIELKEQMAELKK